MGACCSDQSSDKLFEMLNLPLDANQSDDLKDSVDASEALPKIYDSLLVSKDTISFHKKNIKRLQFKRYLRQDERVHLNYKFGRVLGQGSYGKVVECTNKLTG